jgi:hypothetical protein
VQPKRRDFLIEIFYDDVLLSEDAAIKVVIHRIVELAVQTPSIDIDSPREESTGLMVSKFTGPKAKTLRIGIA